MAIKVLITRHFRENALVDLMITLSRLRAGAMNRPGYITGETLVSRDNPHKLVVISTWDDDHGWEAWKQNQTRLDVEASLEPHLSRPTEYEVFHLGARPT